MTDLCEVRDAVRAAARAAFVRSARLGQLARGDRLYRMTMSGLGGCMRQAAYRLAGVPPTDGERLLWEEESRASLIGTWIHAGYLEHLAYYLGEDILAEARHEVRVSLTAHGVTIDGSTDTYTDALGGGVVDLKTTFAHGLDSLTDTPRDEHWWQVMGYACGMEEQGYPVAWVSLLYMDRSSGEYEPLLLPFGEREREMTRERVGELAAYAKDPTTAPRLYGHGRQVQGPGHYRCDGCPWLRECFGAAARPGDTRARALFAEEADDGVAWAMRGYREAHQRHTEAMEDKKFYMSVIKAAQPRPGEVYGGFRYTLGKPQMMTDVAEAERRLRAAGIPVPKKQRAPATFIRPVRS